MSPPAPEWSCRRCGGTQKYVNGACKECSKNRTRKYRLKPRANQAEHLKRHYGLSLEEYDRMVEEAGSSCSICSSLFEPTYLRRRVVDRCHRSSVVRGIICGACNQAIGLFRDNPESLRRAADYVERFAAG